MTPSDPDKVLIVDPAYLGDAVFDAALARAVKARWPTAQVGLVVRPPSDQLVPFMPHVDRAHVFDKRGADRGLRGLSRVARQIGEASYDLALVPHPSIRSAWLASRVAPVQVGAATGWWARRLYTRTVDTRGLGLVASRLALLDPPAELEPLHGALRADEAPGGREAPVGLALGSQWATKRWPVARAAEAVRALAPARVRVIGAPWEAPLMAALEAELGDGIALEGAHAPGIDALVRSIATCGVVIAGDTGPLHIARALGVPTVGLFGPTTEKGHPLGARDVNLTEPVTCRPCSVHGDRRCPEGHHRCLSDLAGGRVADAAARLRAGSE